MNLPKNGNLYERPDLKSAKSGHSYKSPFMEIANFGKSGNCHFWLVKVPLRQLVSNVPNLESSWMPNVATCRNSPRLWKIADM